MTRPPDDQANARHDHDEDFLDLEAALTRHYQATAPASLPHRIRELTGAEQHANQQGWTRASSDDRHQETIPAAHERPRTRSLRLPQEEQARWPVMLPSQTAFDDRGRSAPAPWIMAARRGGAARLVAGATLGLVAGVALTLFLVYMPDFERDQSPIELSAGWDATETAEASAGPASGEEVAQPAVEARYGTAADGTSYVQVPYGDCSTVTPLGFDEVMSRILPEDGSYRLFGTPPDAQIATSQIASTGLTQWDFTELPAGDPASREDIDAIVQSYSLYRGCETLPLRQATVMSSDGQQRAAFRTPNTANTDGRVVGDVVAVLWLDGQEQGIAEPPLAGAPSGAFLYDFRVIDESRVAAYVSRGSDQADPTQVPTLYQDAGYVVFVEQDGQWLIDEQFVR